MSIKIADATIARGYSGYDHLLDDSPLAAMIGREYADLAAACRSAGKLLRRTQDKRCAGAPVILTDDVGNGWLRWTDGSAT